MTNVRLERFIGEYGKDIYSFCSFLTKSKQEADDLYQDSFVKVLGEREFPEDYEDAKNRILSEAVRLWKDRKRKFAWRKRIWEESYIPEKVADEVLEPSDSPEEHMIRSEEKRRIRECVDSLPEKMRLVVLLYYMENRKMNEIAETLHIPLGTVKSRLHQAKEILSDELAEYQKGGLDA